MAINKVTKVGYGQIELNQVAWRRDGRIEAQCKLDATTDFATAMAENGMLLAVDAVNKKLFAATVAKAATMPIGVNYSSEHIYDERTPGLKNFALGKNDMLPRVGYPAVGDKFTTNALAYDTTVYADQDAVEAALTAYATTAVYGGILDGAAGLIGLSKVAPSVGPIMRVIEYTTMPDGQPAVKLQVIKVV